MSKLTEITLSSPRSLPVLLLADVSGSMSRDGKIDILNNAVSEMIRSFADQDAAISVCVITFGGSKAEIHQELLPARLVNWNGMSASGKTPLGSAFMVAREIIEDYSIIKRRDYRPTIILVSDGFATDEWEQQLELLINSGRGSKAFRFAMGIGDDADMDTLKRFLSTDGSRVFTLRSHISYRSFLSG